VCGDDRHQAVAPGPRLTDCDQPSVAARLLAQAPERIPELTAEQDGAAVLPDYQVPALLAHHRSRLRGREPG
jgi:hypothetical protein